MSPGYVYIRPDLQALRLTRAEEDGSLVVEVGVPLTHHALARDVRPPFEVEDWHTPWSSEDGYRNHWPPANEKKPAVLVSALLEEPAGDWDLFVPSGGESEEALVDDAQQAVQTVARLINEHIGPRVAALLADR